MLKGVETDVRHLPRHCAATDALPDMSHFSQNYGPVVVVQYPSEAVEHEPILGVECAVSLAAALNRLMSSALGS